MPTQGAQQTASHHTGKQQVLSFKCTECSFTSIYSTYNSVCVMCSCTCVYTLYTHTHTHTHIQGILVSGMVANRIIMANLSRKKLRDFADSQNQSSLEKYPEAGLSINITRFQNLSSKETATTLLRSPSTKCQTFNPSLTATMYQKRVHICKKNQALYTHHQPKEGSLI